MCPPAVGILDPPLIFHEEEKEIHELFTIANSTHPILKFTYEFFCTLLCTDGNDLRQLALWILKRTLYIKTYKHFLISRTEKVHTNLQFLKVSLKLKPLAT
jgi:hypothetical protein